MDFIFAILFSVLKFGFNIFCDLVVFGMAWFVTFLAFAVAIFAGYFPLDLGLNKVPVKYERLTKLKNLIANKGEKICTVLVVVSCVLSLPTLFLGANKTVDLIDAKIRENKPHEIVTGTEVRQYKLLELSSPKHVYANFEDTVTHQVYSQMYVGTYCPGKSQRLGEKYNIKITRYHMSDDPDSKYIRFNNLPGVFCE